MRVVRWFVGHCPFSGFTDSIVPATGLWTERAPLAHSEINSPRSSAGESPGAACLFCPAEARAIDPHAVQDHADLARQGNFRPLRPAPFGDVHSPPLQRREARHA